MEQERLVRATQYCNKVCLEGLDCFLSDVLAITVWWDQLEGHVVLLDGVLEFHRALIVEDMPLGFNSCCFEAVYQMLVLGVNHCAGCATFHCFDQNSAAVKFNQHHHILVADGETTSLAGVYFEEGFVVLNIAHADEDFTFLD
jgi:hypothetical protein